MAMEVRGRQQLHGDCDGQPHFLTRDEVRQPTNATVPARRALDQTACQDYLTSQQTAKSEARLFQRQTTAQGWQGGLCEPFRLQL